MYMNSNTSDIRCYVRHSMQTLCVYTPNIVGFRYKEYIKSLIICKCNNNKKCDYI